MKKNPSCLKAEANRQPILWTIAMPAGCRRGADNPTLAHANERAGTDLGHGQVIWPLKVWCIRKANLASSKSR